MVVLKMPSLQLIKALRASPDVAPLLALPPRVRQEDGSRDSFEAVFRAIDSDGSGSRRARSHCRFVPPTHPLHTRITKIFGASVL
jgi:hypothetical protein